MSTTCDQFCHNQKHRHLREAISTGDIRGMTNAELRTILRIRRVAIPPGADRRRLLVLIRQSEEDDVGGYHGDYWKSPPGIANRISQLSSNFTYKLVNNAVKITAQKEKAKWLIWVTAADDRVCPICEPRHLRRYRPTWFLPNMPAHSGCRCAWEIRWELREVNQDESRRSIEHDQQADRRSQRVLQGSKRVPQQTVNGFIEMRTEWKTTKSWVKFIFGSSLLGTAVSILTVLKMFGVL